MKGLTALRRLLAAVAVLVGLAWLAARLWLGEPVATVPVVEGGLAETVVATGRIITPARIVLGSVMVGTVSQVSVEEGDSVQAGAVLARLDDSAARAAREQAARAVEEAVSRSEQLQAVARPVAEQALNQAEANLALAEQEYARVERLHASGFYSQGRLDEARRALDNARAAREAALAQALANRPEGSEARLTASRLAQARAALDLATARLADTVIRAPVAGVVLRKRVEAGDVVTQGKPLFELAAAGETQIELLVDEKNLGLLRPGQRATVVADAYPDQPFSAELFYIAPGVDAQKGAVTVKLRVPRPPAFLRLDMTVSAEIEVGRRERALILPAEAVREAGSARPWVLVAEAGRAVRRPVRLGLRGSGQVEIAEGLRAGEAVIPASIDVRPGQRVRISRQ